MDYEKAYKNLVAKVKNAHLYAQTDSTKNVLEDILPELRESEDERIRRTLVEYFGPEVQLDFVRGVPIQKIRDWLEKQKERGPLTKEEEYTLQRIIEYLEDETCPPEWISLLHDIYCLPYEKQKEQKPNYCHHEVDETGWAEEYRKAYYDGWNNCNMQHEQLKADHKPAEWSEEDEDMLNSCISSIEEAKENRYAYKETDGDTSYDHEIAWLKSLRPSWKPSDEVVEGLFQNTPFPTICLDDCKEYNFKDGDKVRIIIVKEN